MPRSNNGGPGFHIGEIIELPRGKAMPPETGLTPFWEKEKGLLYAFEHDAKKIDLSVGQFIRYHIRSSITTSKSVVKVAYKISNF